MVRQNQRERGRERDEAIVLERVERETERRGGIGHEGHWKGQSLL